MPIVHQNQINEITRRLKAIENQMGSIGSEMKAVVRGELVDASHVVEQAQMQFGLYTGLCVDTKDVWKQNRIRWFSPLFHKVDMRVSELPWAHAVSSFGGFDDSGVTWVPPAGSTVCLLFENGMRSSPFYIGTTWHRNRGTGAHNWGYPIDEYYQIWEGRRNGYLVGPDDGSQVFPPWNTENYNGYDLTSIVDYASNPEAQRRLTYPNIYGFKTPEKHMIKMVDGDPKCDRKWKRFEIMSSCGNWIMLKDDHLHYAGQWAHPDCGGVVTPGDTSCATYTETEKNNANKDIERKKTCLSSKSQTFYSAGTNDSNTGYTIIETPRPLKSYNSLGQWEIDQTRKIQICDSPLLGFDGHYDAKKLDDVSFKVDYDLIDERLLSENINYIDDHENYPEYMGGWKPVMKEVEDPNQPQQEEPEKELKVEYIEKVNCEDKISNKKIIGGHPSTGKSITKYYKSQVGSNPFFKHRQECRPYRGSYTPQNNQCDLPQSGVQIMSISGHTLVMDDSVEEPSGAPTWEREFDFGCNNHYVGRTYWKSATGHSIEMSDVESPQGDDGANLRGQFNYIRVVSAGGNKIELNDHTVSKPNCPGCPPNVAGENRGIHLQSTSNHTIDMVDEGNEQCAPCRIEGGQPIPKAKKAYVRIRTGYGLEMMMKDESSQEETQQQYIQLFSPMRTNAEYGPHIFRMQESPSGPGYVFLRVGGDYICYTVDNHVTIVGSEEKPADLIEVVSRINVVYTKKTYVNVTNDSHVFVADNNIMLLAGKDTCADLDYIGPIPAPVLVYDPCSGCIRISDRVIASTSSAAPAVSIFQLLPFNKNCK